MIDKKTSYLSLPLPDAGNALAEDCPRIAEALTSLDGYAQAADVRLDGVEASVTTLQLAAEKASSDISSLKSDASSLQQSVHAIDVSAVHSVGTENITGIKTFAEKIFISPKESNYWSNAYIYGMENTVKGAGIVIQNRALPEDSDVQPARSFLALEGYDFGQGRFTLLAQNKHSSTDGGNSEASLVGTSDGVLSWTCSNADNSGYIDAVVEKNMSNNGYIRYASGLQMCWGRVTLNGPITINNVKVTFPKPFAATPRVFSCSNANNGDSMVLVGWEYTTDFTIGCNAGSHSGGQTNWLAIGPWK